MSPQAESLVKIFEEKSTNAIRAMVVLRRAENAEWTITASYYAKYFAIYTFLLMLGVTCENHDCTIALFGHLFKGKIRKELINELRYSKKDRIEAQYSGSVPVRPLGDVVEGARNFVNEVDRLREGLTRQQITELKEELAKLNSSF
jgi:uncharacterized protein (UPF0332 family)